MEIDFNLTRVCKDFSIIQQSHWHLMKMIVLAELNERGTQHERLIKPSEVKHAHSSAKL